MLMQCRNTRIKSGNGNIRNALVIAHWNMGSSYWINKTTELQLMLEDIKPDIALITEANIFRGDPEYALSIPNFSLILPNIMNKVGNCRIAALVLEGVNVQLLDQYMNDTVASIWMKISLKGKKTIHLGGIYREHCWIKQPDPDNNSGHILEQQARWNTFISQWEAASRRADTFVIGDTNLDYNKWDNPDANHDSMTEMVKTRIKTEGFVQTVRGDTRFWPNTTSSLVDQCWTNAPARIMKLYNSPR